MTDYRFSRPLDAPKIRAISLGAGLQSSWLCDAASRGDIGPLPDLAIFSDTGDEPRHVYDHLEELAARIRFPIVRVKKPGLTLAEASIAVVNGEASRSGSAMPPFFTANPNGMLPKQCSVEFKVKPVIAHLREMLGLAPGQKGGSDPLVELWIGISRDEMDRMNTARSPWIHHRFPCIEEGLKRHQLVQWYEERQMRVPKKSSCVYCPFRDKAAWLRMKQEEPEDFERACQVDEAVRDGGSEIEGQLYVHRSRVPLREADLSEDQLILDLDGERMECEGHCNS